jgi:tetratricopeptide (TPR) repeat protein
MEASDYAGDCWRRGTVVALWYSEWEQKHFSLLTSVPYQVKLTNDTLVFAPNDTDGCIRSCPLPCSARACAHCGKAQCAVECSLCVKRRLDRTWYCDATCQKADWRAQHKQYHLRQANFASNRRSAWEADAQAKADGFSSIAEMTRCNQDISADDEYSLLLGSIFTLLRDGNYRDAIRRCRQAIELMPTRGEAYANLGIAYGRAGSAELSAHAYSQAIERLPWDTATWAKYVAHTIQTFRSLDASKCTFPGWWSDAGIKDLS